MAKLAAKKKPDAPKAPKKPSSRSKTGNAECSQAASNWQLSIRGKATLNPGTYQTLAKCRALSSTKKKADAYGRTGKLSDMGAAALSARADKRFSQGLVTQKSRTDRLNVLLKQRSDRGKLAAPKLAEPKDAPKSEVKPSEFKYVQPSKVDTPAQGVLNDAKRRLDVVNRLIRVQIHNDERWNDGSMGRPHDLMLKKLKLQGQATEARRLMEDAKKAIEKRANELGMTTIKPKPTPKKTESPVVAQNATTHSASYSLGGNLAPGRGTEERKRTAQYILETRKQIAKKGKLIDRNLKKSGRTGYSTQSLAKNSQDRQRFAWNLASMRQHAKKLTGEANNLAR